MTKVQTYFSDTFKRVPVWLPFLFVHLISLALNSVLVARL
jgi:hypothetical protein